MGAGAVTATVSAETALVPTVLPEVASEAAAAVAALTETRTVAGSKEDDPTEVVATEMVDPTVVAGLVVLVELVDLVVNGKGQILVDPDVIVTTKARTTSTFENYPLVCGVLLHLVVHCLQKYLFNINNYMFKYYCKHFCCFYSERVFGGSSLLLFGEPQLVSCIILCSMTMRY